MNESDESAGARRSEELRPLDHAPASSIESSPGAGDSDRLAAILVSIGLAVSASFITREGILHFDDLTHFLFAKWAWTYPAYLLDEWGRPGFTALYFLPAKMGWVWCKLLSAVLTAWSAWFAYRIAQTLKLPHAWAAVPLAYSQPLFFQLAQTTLTETVLAFYLTLAVFLALRHRWSWSAAALSLAFVTRHEAIVSELEPSPEEQGEEDE